MDSVIDDGLQSVIYCAGYFTGIKHCGAGMCFNEYLIHPYAVNNPVWRMNFHMSWYSVHLQI